MNPPPATPGLCYALASDGARLPVIDITHPAFSISWSPAELQAREAAHRVEAERRARTPRWLQQLVYWFFVRQSNFGRHMRAHRGGFLDGMTTYRFKLGPGQLDPAWSTPIDRKIVASFPGLCIRLRLQDMAELLALHLDSRLAAAPGRPVHLINIAGGPCMDSLNALILLRKRAPDLLRGRAVCVDVYDQDHDGPAFAAAALAALQRDGAPLAGLGAVLKHRPYRWDDPTGLRRELARLPRDIIAVASSEGGLFDYGSDNEILANLKVLRDCLPADAAMAGSLTQPKPADDSKPIGPQFAIHERSVPELMSVAAQADWQLAKSVPRPFQTTVLLTRVGTGT